MHLRVYLIKHCLLHMSSGTWITGVKELLLNEQSQNSEAVSFHLGGIRLKIMLFFYVIWLFYKVHF